MWLLAPWLLWASAALADPIDRVVAQVDRELVLASEIVLERDLHRHDPTAGPFWAQAGNDTERRIDAAALRVASGDVGLYQPSVAEVQVRLESVRSSFVDRNDWSRFLSLHGLDEAGLRQELKRRMMVERFLARNVLVDVSDTTAWAAATKALTEQVRARVRIRYVAAEGPP